jgi:hypothetical protein
VKKRKKSSGGTPQQNSQRTCENTTGTPYLDSWFHQVLKQRAAVEEWSKQNKIPDKKSEASVWDSKYSRGSPRDPQKQRTSARQRAGNKCASVEVTAENRINELLELLWADVNLWQSIHDEDSPSDISLYISKKHGLRFPAIPLAVWREIACRPDLRERLFQFHRDENAITGSEITIHGDADFLTVWCGLDNKLSGDALGNLVWQFLFYPAHDHRHLIAALRLSVDELEFFRLAAKKFAAAVQWCAANPGILTQQLASNPSHRNSGIERARSIEAMVAELLNSPSKSNYRLAGSSSSDPKDAALKMAAVARRLVELREFKRVAQYSELRAGRTIGRKPRRHSKTASKR